MNHPVYVTVTEIEQNTKTESLEITCRIYTDDFEKILKTNFETKIDLLNRADSAAMSKLIDQYIQKRLALRPNGKPSTLAYLGYEQHEERIQVYYEVRNIAVLNTLDIKNSLLYDYKNQQMGLIHLTVKGKRQTTRLINPEEKARFSIKN